jgi:hypothetical protein
LQETGENMNSKTVAIVSSLLVCSIFSVVIAIHAQQSAGVQMPQPGADITSGKSFVLEITLNEPLPNDSSVIARVRPDGASQQIIQLQSSTPEDSSRTKFSLKTVLPTPVTPGKWHLESVFVTLPGSIQWQNLDHNPLTFEVQGKPFEIPSKAEVTFGR